MSNVSSELLCHRCGAILTPGEGSFYIVRIEAIADPSPPNLDLDAAESLEELATDWQRLLDQMREMSEQELMDQVYRRLTLHVCAACYRHWIEQPLGH